MIPNKELSARSSKHAESARNGRAKTAFRIILRTIHPSALAVTRRRHRVWTFSKRRVLIGRATLTEKPSFKRRLHRVRVERWHSDHRARRHRHSGSGRNGDWDRLNWHKNGRLRGWQWLLHDGHRRLRRHHLTSNTEWIQTECSMDSN